MKRKYFINIVNNLQLVIEHIFIEYERPILFLCKDERTEEKYLCLCYECRQIQKWIIAQVDEDLIYKMVCGNVSVRQTFLDCRSWILIEYDGVEEKSKEISAEELGANIEILPEEDVSLDEDERDEYLTFLAAECKTSIQRTACDSMKTIEGLSDTMREILKNQYYSYDINWNITNKISAGLSKKISAELFYDTQERNIVLDRTDTILSTTLDNGKNILEMDEAFSSAA